MMAEWNFKCPTCGNAVSKNGKKKQFTRLAFWCSEECRVEGTRAAYRRKPSEKERERFERERERSRRVTYSRYCRRAES